MSASAVTPPTGPITTYTPTSSTNGNASGTASANGNTLTQNDFLNLLVTQLQNQDPTNPQSDEDFAAQMAQFASLTDMGNMNTTMTGMSNLQQLSSATSLIGQTVTTDVTDSAGNLLTGVVSSASIQNGALTLDVGGQNVNYGDITGVQPTTTS
jgi:flagellar basal-body rod modification protein FlgD